MTVCKPSKSQLKLWEKLELAKYRQREGLFLAEGFKVVQELLKSKSPWETKAILVMEEKRERWEAFLSTIPENAEIYLLSARQWSKLSQDKEPEGIMALADIPRPANISGLSPPEAGYLLLLHQIRNPNNLGAIMRTAHWFGIRTVILSADSVDFTNSRVVRSSMGSVFHLTIIPEIDFIEVLPRIKKHYSLIGSHVRIGIPPHPCPEGTALLLGSESHGLSEQIVDMIDEQWCIPGMGDAESLSLPQAGAIMMYECRRGGNKS
ncbi:MAG: RNA methyltransferase [Syntrophales bacterium]|nr:RNA methyltransferase [Syntrophales bacterium]